MNIVTALETLAVEGMERDHDHVIETILSKLFVRGDEVHKAYKHRIADFADLTDKETRRAYIAEDFSWNHIMAPEVYLELRHVICDGDQYIHVEEARADDWYIVMKKIDSEKDLIHILEKRAPTERELRDYARVLTERLRDLTKAKGAELSTHIEKGADHVRSEILGTCDWASMEAAPELTHAEVMDIKKILADALEREAYFQQPIALSVIIDTNPDNIIFLDEGVSFIDVMPPKDTWRVHDRYFALCRTSADVSALAQGSHAAVLHAQYGEDSVLPPEIVRMVYELAAALIQVPYRKMIGRDDLAARYADYVRVRTSDLSQLLKIDPVE